MTALKNKVQLIGSTGTTSKLKPYYRLGQDCRGITEVVVSYVLFLSKSNPLSSGGTAYL